ncbi:uncharacterized protein [Panulirus ornatus]|uniref:uncharacterized protein n=1 Tax=Panulirus ornatus TaxID=150431 RepID=UPI003A88A895
MRAIFRLLVLTIAFDLCTAGPRARAQKKLVQPRGFIISRRAPGQVHRPPHHIQDTVTKRTTTISTIIVSRPYSLELRHRRRMRPIGADHKRHRPKRSTTGNGTQVQYKYQEDRKFRHQGDHSLYLASNATGTSLELATQATANDNHTCFRMHFFDLLTPIPDGEAVVIETHDGGRFLQADTSGNLFIQAGGGQSISEVGSADNKFFIISSARGDDSFQIKHFVTGRFLSAGDDGVSLISTELSVSDGTLFEMFPCSSS